MDTAEVVGPGDPSSAETAAVSDESPKEPPPRSPEPRNASVVLAEDGKQPTAKKTTAAADVAPTALSKPTPPHCLGARGYDLGYFDVGSFFVFHKEPPASGASEAAAGTSRGVDSQLLAPPPSPSPAGTESPSADSAPSPLGYDFLDGLKVKPSEHRGKAVEGEGSEEAMAAFVELQRQVRPQRLEVVVGMPAVFTRPK